VIETCLAPFFGETALASWIERASAAFGALDRARCCSARCSSRARGQAGAIARARALLPLWLVEFVARLYALVGSEAQEATLAVRLIAATLAMLACAQG
jgi:hypothetical protein